VQGFFITVGFIVPWYNAALCVYFSLVINYNKTESWLRKNIELYFHLVPIVIVTVMGVAGFVFQVFNFTGVRCFVSPYPTRCDMNPNVDCTRGESYFAFRYSFAIQEVIIFVIILVCMSSIVVSTRRQERRQRSWDLRLPTVAIEVSSTLRRRQKRNQVRMKRTKQVARQAFMYVGACFLTFVWTFIFEIAARIAKRPPFKITVITFAFLPLQGFFNFIIFNRFHATNGFTQLSSSFSSIVERSSSVLAPIRASFLSYSERIASFNNGASNTLIVKPGAVDVTADTRNSIEKSPYPAENDAENHEHMFEEVIEGKRVSISGQMLAALALDLPPENFMEIAADYEV